MWNKLFKSKSKSSKNLSSSSGGSSSTGTPSPPLDLVPIYNIDRNRYEQDIEAIEVTPDDVELRRNHNRDSIGPQMCGIPMRKSKFSNAFKSLSLRRGSSKNQLKLYPGVETIDIPISVEDIQISTSNKRASLRPSKSDNNLNEKQNYADPEKEDPPTYIDEYRPHVDPFLELPDPPENLKLQPCPICARNFVPASLAKHVSICEKMQSKKRKPFDSSRQRREGTELASYLPKNFGLPQNHPQARVSPPKTTNPVRKLSTSKTPTPERKDYSGGGGGNNNIMSSSQTLASTTSSGGGGGGGASTTPRPILKRSLSQQNEPCPYCERCFGFKAYDRHVEWCREKALLNKNIQQQSSIAKERLQARIQYKAPQLKSKRALNREKYSGSLSCGGSTSSLADLDLPFPRHRSHLNSMSSSLSSDNGYTPDRYDPFLSAKRQLEELFSPTSSFNTATARQQQTSNGSRVTTPVTPSPTAAMSKSVVVPANKTSPIINSNFRRASSLRMPRKVSRPMFIEKAKSNIQKGITDDGPVSPNFLKSSEYDEIPIKSAFNALQMAEKPKMRDSSATRRNLKLDIKDPNLPATDIPLSKTDSLAVFLKYEHELNLMMSEKEMKDKSNSLSKRSSSLGGHERKESMPYSPTVTEKVTVNDRPSHEEKGKSDKPIQEIQSLKKLPQKLVPIKLDPINITYNSNSNNTSKPTVISLDTILGKSNKPKAAPEEKLVRKESNYIDPKLINKCDNLPITVTKLTPPEVVEVVKPIEKPSPGPKRLARPSGTSPETEGGGGKEDVKMPSAVDNRLSDISTKSDSSDTRPTLTRQNGTASCTGSSISGDSSREESPTSQPSSHSPQSHRNQSRTEDAKSQTPDSGLERSTPKPSTPITVAQKKPERPPLPSFDDFDFEEFISSFEDERRSFQNAFYSRNPTSNSSNSSFNQRVNNSFTDNSVKSAVNGSSNSNTSSPSHHHFASPLSQSYYKSLNTNGRSEEEDTSRQKQPQQQSRESPQVPPRRTQPPESSTIRNLPSIKNLPGSPGPSPLQPNHPNSIFSYGSPNADTSNNNNTSSSSPLVKASPSATSRLGSGHSFNNSPLTTHQPYQHQQQQPSVAKASPNMISAAQQQQPSPLYDHQSRQQSPLATTTGGNNNGGTGNIIFDDLSPTERDLMKSVQELDRMCESSSSMYPADSDEVSSVEGYPLSSRDRGHHQRPSEGSKFSADSAYGSSLSRQSPQQDPVHTIRRHHHHHHHRGGSKSSSTSQQQDAFDNSSGSESSLPPITTATLKAQKIELHSHSNGSNTSSGSTGGVGGAGSAKLPATMPTPAAGTAAMQMSKFCHECGSRFMINTAKFCMECGVRRIMLD